MSRSLRAQVSLIFSDEDIFDNFVTPLKENKELSCMIVKLLTVYYNNEEIRNQIEGVSLDDLDGADQVIDSTEAINQMRQTLAMQDFLFEQAKQTLDDGVSEMDVLMRVNDIAEQSGVVRTESTETGEALVQLSLESSTLRQAQEQSSESGNTSSLESRVGKIEEALTNIMNMLQNGAFGKPFGATHDEQVVVKVEDEPKTPILNDENEVLNIDNNTDSKISEPIVNEVITQVDIPNPPADEQLVVDVVQEAPVREVEPPTVEVAPPTPIREVAPPTPIREVEPPSMPISDESSISEDAGNSKTGDEDASSELGDVLKDLLG